MASVLDVAAYVLQQRGSMTAMKLQKLVYYSQAWSLVWNEKPLFPEKIKAWANGPVSPFLHFNHRGRFMVSPGEIPGDESHLDEDDRKTVDSVLGFYADKDPEWLSDLTHRERPWKEARKDIAPGERGDNEITLAAMAEYYGSL